MIDPPPPLITRAQWFLFSRPTVRQRMFLPLIHHFFRKTRFLSSHAPSIPPPGRKYKNREPFPRGRYLIVFPTRIVSI
ncbi:MAG: hypothetical protein CMH76_02215 [Nitrospinae bacterium]|nr:hypothetical protein [Nitrospinota bacterium]